MTKADLEARVAAVLKELGDDPEQIAGNLLTNRCIGPREDPEH